MPVNHLPRERPAAWSWRVPATPPVPTPGRGRELLFEKPLTPSDVGKLNRLVIPKQHAEKYFPLEGDSGLLLSFEDDLGKLWQFRYSYWTSSQSYVLTKGWSRFIREKRLHAGDVVLFHRRRCYAGDRIFISWKRRPVQRGQGYGNSGPALPPPEEQQHVLPSSARGGSRMLRLFGVNLRCGPVE